jgi:hypothetical protein
MPRRQWIKLWTQEVIHGTTLKELEPDERAVWFELLCIAGDSVVPGKICISIDCPYTEEQLCKLLNVNNNLLKRSLSKLSSTNVKKIKTNGNGIIEICNFEKYQGSEAELNERREYMKKYMRDYRKLEKLKEAEL